MEPVKVFVSHDWTNGNHLKVMQVVRELQKRLPKNAFSFWVDEDCMRNNIIDAMSAAIEKAGVCLVFVTGAYMQKAASKVSTDNVRREFMYMSRHGKAMIPVKFDASLPNVWTGPVGMMLSNDLYVDLSPSSSPTCVDELISRLRHASPSVLWKTAGFHSKRAALAKKPASLHSEGTTTGIVVRGTAVAAAEEEGAVPGKRVKDKVRRLFHAAGMTFHEDAHSADQLHRLLASLVGRQAEEEMEKLPFCDKLARAEKELGLQ